MVGMSDAMEPLASAMPRFVPRDVRLYQAGRLLAIVAEQMISVAVGWQVYARTGRPFDLGLVGLVQFVPAIGLSLVAGHATDRFDRRQVVMVACASLTCVAVALAVTARAGSAIWQLYALLFVFAIGRAFLAPASQALLADLVPPAQLARTVAWSSSLWEIAAIVGPALGGWMYSIGHGAGAVYVAGAIAYLAALASTAAMAVRTGRMEQQPVSWSTVVAGVVYVWRNTILLGTISLDLFAVLFGGAAALLPVFARDVLQVGPWGLGLLRSAPAVGAALAAIVIGWRPLERRAGATMLVGVALYGAATVVFGASRYFGLSLLALAVVGAADMVSVVVRSTLVQVVTPPVMRGRVSAVNMVFIGASSELGALESGMTAAWLGAVPSVIAGGVAACLVVAAYAVLFPGLRAVDRLGDG